MYIRKKVTGYCEKLDANLITTINLGVIDLFCSIVLLEVTVTACLSSKKHWTSHRRATSQYCTRMAGSGMIGRNF